MNYSRIDSPDGTISFVPVGAVPPAPPAPTPPAPTPPAPTPAAPPPPLPDPTWGKVGTVVNYGDGYVALNGIEMEGKNAVYTLGIKVAPNDSSVGKTTLPVWVGTNSPVSQISQRTVSVSLTPGDFDPATAQIVASGNPDFAVSFTTEPARLGQGVALLQPGRTHYVNVRNDSARAGAVIVLDGQYKNWNR